jgi:hypothetical protein
MFVIPPDPVESPSKIVWSLTELSQYPYPWKLIAAGLTVAPDRRSVTYSLYDVDPNCPPLVAGPTNLRVGSTASIA